MDVDPTETEEALKEASDESVSVAIPPLASSQVDVTFLLFLCTIYYSLATLSNCVSLKA